MVKYLFIIWLSAVSCFANQREVMEVEEVPQYLYKIISLKHWDVTQKKGFVFLSAADNAFIHFSKEDQLERILTKYWAEAPEVVVLKIKADKLKGKLVYESNPGGSTKYYHLYDGLIPFASIAESKIVYRHSSDECCSRGLEITSIGNPVLREKARELSKEEILSPEIQTLIKETTETMRAAPGVGLAAPQIGKSVQLIVVEDMDHGHLTAEQLAERERYKVPFHVIINPRMYVEGSETAEFFEGCLSVPEFLGIVPRAKSVRVECLNERGEPVVLHAKGWYARILQHEIDHLNGKLYIDRALLPTLMTEENYFSLWKGKTINEIVSKLTKKKIVTIDNTLEVVLKRKTEEIQEDELPLAKQIAEQLYQALEPYFPAAGLAAPQIGISKSVFIFSFDRDPKNLEVVINPSFEPLTDAKEVGWEGCLSVMLSSSSWKLAKLGRYEAIRVKYLDLEGKWIEKVLEGFAAKVFQHEYDHLQGTVNINREDALVKAFDTKEEMMNFMKEVKKADSARYKKP